MEVSSLTAVDAVTGVQSPLPRRRRIFHERSARVSSPAVLPATGFRSRLQRRLRTLHVAILRNEPFRPGQLFLYALPGRLCR